MIETRKNQHIDIVLQQDVEHRGGSLLDCVELLHQSLPELDLDDIDLSVRVFGRTAASPLMIAGMTGGSERAGDINRRLAAIAQQNGTAMGVGSMRPILVDERRRSDYDLRGLAPDVPLLGNLGVMQAAELPVDEVAGLLHDLGFDALCLHLNPAQELAQAEGDRAFRGAVDTLARFREELDLPLVVKETGAGLSPQALDAIRSVRVDWVDVSGRGGTSWTRVEAARPDAPPFGGMFGDWGIPTAASTAWAVRRGFRTISSGGIRTVLDVLRALALGATLVGAARPVLVALEDSERDAGTVLGDWIEGLRRGLLLVGARRPAEVAHLPRLLMPPLRDWIALDANGEVLQ